MSETKKNYASIIIIAILALLLGGAGFMYFQKDTELKNTKIELNTQIDDLTSNLEQQKSELDLQIANNEVLNEDLIAQRDELEATLDELRSSQVSIANLKKFEGRYYKLKGDIKDLLVENEMLQTVNKTLTVEKDSISGELNLERVLKDSLANRVVENEKVILKASEVAVLGLKGLGIKERSSGKQILTDKASRANKVKICFSLAPNTIAEKGAKDLYIQVISPQNNVLGENAQITFDDKLLNYSFKTGFNYDNKALDICEYLSEPKDGFVKGTYHVNVFRGAERVAKNTFKLE